MVVNPTAGKGRAGRLAPKITSHLGANGIDVRPLVGRDADEASALAHSAVANGIDALVAVGGDGTVALALQAVASTQVPLGILAIGTGNDIARAFGVPWRDPYAGADAIIAGTTRRVDLGLATTMQASRWFAGVLATGFDTRVNERANAMRRPRGRARYHIALIAELGRLAPMPYEITVDDVTTQTTATLVAVGNGPSYGGGMQIAPGAEVTDGMLDLTVIGILSRARLVRLFPEIYPGTFVRHDIVHQARCRTVELASPGGLAYADGERLGPLPVRAEAMPGALRVLAPAPGSAGS
jgi:diacylglycerol kinase (ATP)